MEVTGRYIRIFVVFAGCWAALATGAGAMQDDSDQQAEHALQEGIALTRRGQFQQAIPQFLAARGRVADSFALEFNLALCYTGSRQFPQAIAILTRLESRKRPADVKNLLAQAYAGNRQQEPALKALKEAAAITPGNERLYLLVAQMCLDEALYDLGLKVLDIGLANLPNSARLHFERGLFHSQQEDSELANQEFALVRKLAPGSEIAYISATQQALLSGEVQEAVRSGREGIRAGHTHYLLLTMLGEALLRAGAAPGSDEYREAQEVLEKAVAARPGYSSSHIALGRIYLALGRVQDAVAQLEAARQINPDNKAVYAPLAAAYRRTGQADKAREALAALAALNRETAERIGSAEGGHAGYTGGKPPRQDPAPR